MRNSFLRRFFFITVLLAAAAQGVFAQLTYFIYLQTDNQQPFYIKYNNRIYSSSGTGYLILPKLKEGAVEFSIGFPKSNQVEQKFQCLVEKADKGYLIKNFADKGWGLFDLQTSNVLYAAAPADVKVNSTVTSQPPATNDPFANMLSKVTQDSTVKNVVVKKEEPVVVPDPPKPVVVESKPEVVQKQPVIKDSPKTTVVTPAPIIPEPVLPKEPEWVKPVKSAVVQLQKVESAEGNDYMFEVEENGLKKDTVRLFIEKEMVPGQVVVPPTVEVKMDTVVVTEEKMSLPSQPQQPEVKKEEPVEKTEPKPETKPEVKPETPKSEEVKEPVTTEQKTNISPLPNSNCKVVANEDDFIKLRRKMANESTDESMINEAKKVFKTKCFSTVQVKNLAVLFLNDEGKYRFYDAAMAYVSDFSNFKTLSDTIQDDYFKKRFFALLPNQ